MGNCLASLVRRRPRRHIVLILIGLDNAGKTKTVNNLAGSRDFNVLPTVGFKAVNLVHKDTPVTIYDLGGGLNFRQIWPQYYSEVHGVIFVLDSSDFSRLDECKDVLEEVLSNDRISGKPILVLANKQDKEGALDDIDVVEKLSIEPLVNKYRCPTLVESYSASLKPKSKKNHLDPGLKKGYQWLLNYISRRYDDINLRVQTDIHADLERRKMAAPNRSSETFTAHSNDDIATQTGFENPNYDNFTQTAGENGLGSSVVIVKPIRPLNSLDTTVTIESVDDSEVTSVGQKPKLSPLFGKASGSSNVSERKIELDSRSEFRKLSPIVRIKNADQHIDFQKRPQSSPSTKSEDGTLSKLSVQKSLFKNGDETFLAEGWGGKRTTLDEELVMGHREIMFAERSHITKTTVSSEYACACTTRGAPAPPRPASASALSMLRRQLELQAPQRRRLLCTRYMHRAKTSPERMGVFHFEPSKLSQKQLDKGDFAHALNYLTTNQRDVGM